MLEKSDKIKAGGLTKKRYFVLVRDADRKCAAHDALQERSNERCRDLESVPDDDADAEQHDHDQCMQRGAVAKAARRFCFKWIGHRNRPFHSARDPRNCEQAAANHGSARLTTRERAMAKTCQAIYRLKS
jgi:hypothetical protein